MNSDTAHPVFTTTSPFSDAEDSAFEVDGDSACLHSDITTVRATGFTGFYVKVSTLFLYDENSCQWAPWLSVEGLPADTWIRFVDADGSLLIPVELNAGDRGLLGRWLDQAGNLLPLGMLDHLRGAAGETALEGECRRHPATIDGWQRLGGRAKAGETWIPSRPTRHGVAGA